MKKLSITKLIVLNVLEDEPFLNGYQLMKRFDPIGGISSGTLYPLLHEMVGDELITYKTSNKKQLYKVTKTGRAESLNLRKNLDIVHGFITALAPPYKQ